MFSTSQASQPLPGRLSLHILGVDFYMDHHLIPVCDFKTCTCKLYYGTLRREESLDHQILTLTFLLFYINWFCWVLTRAFLLGSSFFNRILFTIFYLPPPVLGTYLNSGTILNTIHNHGLHLLRSKSLCLFFGDFKHAIGE